MNSAVATLAGSRMMRLVYAARQQCSSVGSLGSVGRVGRVGGVGGVGGVGTVVQLAAVNLFPFQLSTAVLQCCCAGCGRAVSEG